MIINTRDFGNVEVLDENVFVSELPIIGFEEYKDFVLLSDDEVGQGIYWLQSVDERDICFLLVNSEIFKDYSFTVTQEMRDVLSLPQGIVPLSYCIIVLGVDSASTTVNMKAPLVFSSDKKLFGQFVLDEDYKIRAPFSHDGEVEPC